MLVYIKTLPIATKLWFLVGIFSFVVLADNLAQMTLHGKRLRAEKEQHLEQLVETTHSILRHYQGEAQAGRMSDSDARRQAIQAIRPLRYSDREYFWIHDLGQPVPRMVMHPTVPKLDGTVLDQSSFLRATSSRRGSQGSYQQLTGDNLFLAMNDVARSSAGQGFVAYDWPKPLAGGGITAELFPKLSFVKRFEPWGWVIGSGIYMDEFEVAYWRDAQGAFIKVGLWLVLFGLMVWAILRTIVRPLRALQGAIDDLRGNPDGVVRLPADPPQELGQLAHSFQSLMGELQQSRQAQQASLADLRLAGCAFAEMSEGVMVTDAVGRIVSINPAFTRISGYTLAETIGHTPSLLKSGQHTDDFYAAMWGHLKSEGSWSGEIWNRARDGHIYPEWLNISTSHDSQGQVVNYVGVFFDITERKAAEADLRIATTAFKSQEGLLITSRQAAEDEINKLAFYDPLTLLPNRRLLIDRLRHALSSSKRSGQTGALLLLDLDNFKTLNDANGHNMGDLLLQAVAKRLSAGVRETDTVARFGGDEFAVLLEGLSLREHEAGPKARVIAEKLLATLNQPYDLGGVKCHNTSSIGITLFVDHKSTIEDLLKQAELAMYQAKAAGRNTLCLFNPEMEAIVSARAVLEADLREALHEGQFFLHYQPQVDRSGHLIGAEALARWKHPVRGFVSPGEFIPLAEDTGLILPLGRWVLETACRQLAVWADEPALAHLCLAVNVSAVQYRQPDFVAQVLAALELTGANPNKLKLELTEGLLLDNVEDIICKMGLLKAQGVSFSLDDFGTGYSSLSYLKRLPIDQLKIDQSFVRDLLTDPNDAAIIRTIVALAENLGLSVIAEGVETQAQRDSLSKQGCHHYQGYFFGRPGPAENLRPQLPHTLPGHHVPHRHHKLPVDQPVTTAAS